jgi:hypothetical protein
MIITSPFKDDCQTVFFDGAHDESALQSAWQIYKRYLVQ